MNKLVIAVMLITTLGMACKEVIEEDISKQQVAILAPTDQLVTSNSTITFWWNEVEDALKYNVQVVSPSFNGVQKIWADTNVIGSKFELTLTPGVYQWRIRAFNGSSTTEYITSTFSIDSTFNIANQSMVLLSPVDSAVSNVLQQTCKWSVLYNADDYRFRIVNSANEALTDVITKDIESSYTFTTEGYYSWSVRGQNAISNTAYTTHVLLIDRTAPGQPILSTPLNNATITADSISFSWTRAVDTGSPLFDSLYIYSDAALSQRLLVKKLTTTTYKDSLSTGTYYWQVKTVDKAGNIGTPSTAYKFIIN